MHYFEEMISKIAEVIWQIFLPILVVAAIYVGFKTIFVIKNKTTEKSSITFKQFVGPTSIALGAMIGTGAIIGVLGALDKYAAAGQMYVEGLVFWALVGSLIMVPLSYAETMLSKVMGKVPKDMIATLIGKRFAAVYAVGFVLLYVFGFGGFQFSGIGSIISLMGSQFFELDLSAVQRYLYIVIPLIIFTSAIILSKKHEFFINSMASMIGIAVFLYFVFFVVFIVKTADYLPTFMSNMVLAIQNPGSMFMGMPIGIMLAIQRISQTTESGIGGLPMAAAESDTKARAAAVISLIPVLVTIFVAIVVTTYITSYGMSIGEIILPSDDFSRLSGLFDTIYLVTGNFGLGVLAIFALFSGASTLLGSFYYVQILFENNSENKNIALFIIMITIAGTLATFGFSVVFDAVDLLMFLVTGINVLALIVFVSGEWKKYIIKK